MSSPVVIRKQRDTGPNFPQRRRPFMHFRVDSHPAERNRRNQSTDSTPDDDDLHMVTWRIESTFWRIRAILAVSSYVTVHACAGFWRPPSVIWLMVILSIHARNDYCLSLAKGDFQMKVKSLLVLAVAVGSLAYSAMAIQQPHTLATNIGECCSSIG